MAPASTLQVDVRSSQGATALMFAADAGDGEVCALLLRAGADPFVTCLKTGGGLVTSFLCNV